MLGAQGCVIEKQRERARNANTGNQLEAEERDALATRQTKARYGLQHYEASSPAGQGKARGTLVLRAAHRPGPDVRMPPACH